jgi:hypothetical protein
MNGMLVSIILALLVFGVTISIYASTEKKVSNMKPYLIECKLTLGADLLTQDISWLIGKVEDACYTVRLDNLNDFRRPSDIMTFSANRMAQAWGVTWDGSKNLFDEDGGAFFQSAGHNCRIFFDLDYTHPKYKGTIPAQEFLDFLTKENYSDTGITYSEYLQGKTGNGAFFIADKIEPGKHYVVSIMSSHQAKISFFEKDYLAQNSLVASWVANKLDTGLESVANSLDSFQDYLDQTNGDLNMIIVFSNLTWAEENGCVYKGVSI